LGDGDFDLYGLQYSLGSGIQLSIKYETPINTIVLIYSRKNNAKGSWKGDIVFLQYNLSNSFCSGIVCPDPILVIKILFWNPVGSFSIFPPLVSIITLD
jgi:hypothetical protein